LGDLVTDYIRLKQDAEYVLDMHGAETPNGRLALTILHALEHGLAPEGHAIVPRPQLLGLGVPQR
jgi:hypothetical protein